MSTATELFLEKYNSYVGLPGLEFETAMSFNKNIKFNHSKAFTLLSGMASSVEIMEHLDVYYPGGARKTIYFSKGVNQKRDSAQRKISLEQPFSIKRHVEGVKNIKTKISQEVSSEIPSGNPDFMRFKLRIKFIIPGKKWTAELDLIKEVKSSGVDLKSVKDVIFKPYSLNNLLNSIEYSIFGEMRLEFEYSGKLDIEEFFEPINLFSKNLNGDDNYQRQIFLLARNIIFGKKSYLETFRSKSGLKKLLNNVLEVNADTFYKKVQPKLPLSGFYITDKIDGLRTILCIGRKSYMLNNKLTELEGRSEENTYIDCELVGNTLHAFDVIVCRGNVVSTKPFSHRLSLLQEAVGHAASVVTSMEVVAKRFVLLNSEWKSQLREFYETERPYDIDGLIFTPNDSSDYQSMVGYKWKPAEHSTIDFYIKKTPSTYVLMSGASKQDIDQFDLKTITNVDPKSLNPVLFTPSNAPDVYKYESADDSLDGKIGEFGWSQKNKSWELRKIRTDRNVELARKEYYGNYFKVAESIWYSIHNPLSFDQLFLESEGYFSEDNSEKYKIQRNFNSRVKTEVLEKCIDYLKDNGKLGLVIDLAAGKGQDMARIFNMGVTDAIFVDNDANALQELIRRKHTLTKWQRSNDKTKVTTSQLDLTKDHKILEREITSAYGSKVSASLVMCNFAIHYFTGSSETFNNLISLVKSILADDGIFVFTCFDGRKVFELCGKNGWEYMENGEYKYSIKPLYDSQVLEPFGQKVKLILPFTRGEYYEEYLVNLGIVSSILTDNGFFKEAIGSFGNFREEKLSEDEKTFTDLYSYCVFRKNPNSQAKTIQLSDENISGGYDDDRDRLLNLPQANSIKITTLLTGAALAHVINCFEELGYRNYDKNKKLRKKIFTFSDKTTDTEVDITTPDIENYMQWITKFCVDKITISDCAVMNKTASATLHVI